MECWNAIVQQEGEEEFELLFIERDSEGKPVIETTGGLRITGVSELADRDSFREAVA